MELSHKFEKKFPLFSQTSLREMIIEESDYVEAASGTVLLDLNQVISGIPLVLEGIVKVTRIDQQGKEILLYYIKPGESCAMTLSSSIKRGVSMVRAVAQNDVKLLMLPLRSMLSFRVLYPTWNDYVVATFAHRFDEMINLVEDLTFHQVDYRLNKYLLAKATLFGQRELRLSHQQIAQDINTSREVVSRLLKRFEKEGTVKLHRGRITLLNGFDHSL